MVDKEKLEESMEYFDDVMQKLVGENPEWFDPKWCIKHYNIVRNALAFYMVEEKEKE